MFSPSWSAQSNIARLARSRHACTNAWGIIGRRYEGPLDMKTLAEVMAEFALGLRFEDLPAAVVHEVKRRVIDSLGCALGAWLAAPSVVARQVAARYQTTGSGATLLGTRSRVPPDWAAFANGCLVRYLDYNDTYLSKEPAHPSDNIPAALAVAEAE